MKRPFKAELIAVALIGVATFLSTAAHAQRAITPEEARAIAKEAYIYGYPMVDSYRIEHTYFVNRESPEYKAPWNQILNIPRVFTPEDKAIQTPNSKLRGQAPERMRLMGASPRKYSHGVVAVSARGVQDGKCP